MIKRYAYFILLLFTTQLQLNAKDNPRKTEVFRPQYHVSPSTAELYQFQGVISNSGNHTLYYVAKTNNDSYQFRSLRSTNLLNWDIDKEQIIDVPEAMKTGTIVRSDNELLSFFVSSDLELKYAKLSDNKWIEGKQKLNIHLNSQLIPHTPRIIWHENSQKWILLTIEKDKENSTINGVSFYTSSDLINWDFSSQVIGIDSNPDFFELPIKNQPSTKKWVLSDDHGNYMLGEFNGQMFKPQSKILKLDGGKNFYSPKTFKVDDSNGSRVIQMAWMKGAEFPGMNFNGQLTFPVELSIQRIGDQYQVCRIPAHEITNAYKKKSYWKNKNLLPGVNQNILKSLTGDCLHIQGTFDLNSCNNFGLLLRKGKQTQGVELVYSVDTQTLSCLGKTIKLKPVNGKIKLEILVDRTSLELFANGGQKVMSSCYTADPKENRYNLFTIGGELTVEELTIHTLNSMYQ
ncbi:hypothetical protein EYV94_17440 [Puteibacter caeruleilacunae]|nr:hypothetical protein EYV94_17440 [Puteibacter caeruleilacunae]